MNTNVLSKVVISIAAVTLLAGCTRSNSPATPNTTTQNPSQTGPATSGPSASESITTEGSTSLAVTLTEYEIAPKIIEVHAGVANTLQVSNDGSMTHTFVISDLGINEQIPAGGSIAVEINNPAAGTYDVICTVAGHEAFGMTAQLFVQ